MKRNGASILDYDGVQRIGFTRLFTNVFFFFTFFVKPTEDSPDEPEKNEANSAFLLRY